MRYYVKKYWSVLTAVVLIFSIVLEPVYLVHAEPVTVTEDTVDDSSEQEEMSEQEELLVEEPMVSQNEVVEDAGQTITNAEEQIQTDELAAVLQSEAKGLAAKPEQVSNEKPDSYNYVDENGNFFMTPDATIFEEVTGISMAAILQGDIGMGTQLLPPSDLAWSTTTPGHLTWSGVSGSEGYYTIEIYRNENHYAIHNWSGLKEKGIIEICECGDGFEESGTYKFRVKAEGSVKNRTEDSDWSEWSPEWEYTKPAAKLSTPSNLRWNKTTALWGSVSNAKGYNVKIYRNGQEFGGVWSHYTGFLSENISRYMNISGRYTFKVRALSDDITQIFHSDLSVSSMPYGTISVADQAEYLLDEALGQVETDPDTALNTVKDNIDVENMAVAMRTDKDVRDKVAALETAYANRKSIIVNTATGDDVANYIDPEQIGVVGAALNTQTEGKQLVLNFDRPDEEIQDSAYPYRCKNTVQFSIDLDGRDTTTDKLAVPVCITIPIPRNVEPERFRILHYHANGTYEELIPQINEEGTLATFTVTDFSTFVFANALTPAKKIALNKTDIALEKVGDTGELMVIQTPANANSNIIWQSEDEGIVTVENGVVTAVAMGITTVFARSEDNSTLIASCKVAVAGTVVDTEMTYLSELGLWMKNVDNQTYTGSLIKPEVFIYDTDRLLTEKVDYTVSYSNNKNIGTANIIITGKGNYTGKGNGTKSANIKFSIVPYAISGTDVTVIAQDKYADSASTQSPIVTLKFGSTTMRKNTDYTVTYMDKNNNALTNNVIPKNATGTYAMVIAGKGNFTGSIKKTFQIVDRYLLLDKTTVTLKSTAKKKTYTGEPITLTDDEITVKMGKAVLVNGIDYTLEYANNTQIGNASATVVPAEGSSYVGSKAVSFAITGYSIASAKVTGIQGSMAYTGSPVTQAGLTLEYTVNRVKTELTEGVDYEITTTNNTNVGTAAICFIGKGNYYGTLKKTFKIAKYNMNQESSSVILEMNGIGIPDQEVDGKAVLLITDPFTYCKGGVKPAPTVKFGETTLVSGKDYTIAYKNQDKVTEGAALKLSQMPNMTITGKGNFSGKYVVYFYINKASIESGASMTVADVVYSKVKGQYKGNAVVLDNNSGKALALGTDYEKIIRYEYASGDMEGQELTKTDVPDSGTLIRVIVTGKGKYQDELSATYKIVPASVAKATVKVKDQVYTGKPMLPTADDITVKIGKATLVAGEDYEIIADGTNITDAGTRSFRIEGKGDNYGGTQSIKFKIKQKSFFWWFF